MFTPDGDDFVVIASNGGRPWHPSWYLNLKRHPEAEVELMSRHYRVRAEDVTADEARDRLWWEMARLYPRYDEYQRKTGRVIPVVRLRPLASDAHGRSAPPRIVPTRWRRWAATSSTVAALGRHFFADLAKHV
jgi:deazaflavin-dependent oxidoreductase (nitroreductase family)